MCIYLFYYVQFMLTSTGEIRVLNMHKMYNTTTQCKVRTCYKCRRHTEFFCSNCNHDLCRPCKQKHQNHLMTIDLSVMIYRDKFNEKWIPGMCLEHPNMVYKRYCNSCKIPVCYQCKGHKNTHSKV